MLIGCICFGFTGFKVIQNNEVKKYVHSKTCQVDNYLQLDCFDSCNGKQVNCQSHQKHNLPSEKTTLNSFETIPVLPCRIVCFTSVILKIKFLIMLFTRIHFLEISSNHLQEVFSFNKYLPFYNVLPVIQVEGDYFVFISINLKKLFYENIYISILYDNQSGDCSNFILERYSH